MEYRFIPQQKGWRIIAQPQYLTDAATSVKSALMDYDENRISARYYTPHYWPTWLLYAVLRTTARLPYRVQLKLGAALGNIVRHVARRRRRIAKTNIARCFPDMSPAEQRELLRAHFRSLGISFIEMANSYWASSKKLEKLGTVVGTQNLDDALKLGRGVILLTGHFTTFEIGGRLFSLTSPPFHAVYRPHHNHLLEKLIRKGRGKVVTQTIPRHDIRAILRSLKENIPVWYAPDQGYRGKNSTMVSFFGHPAPTTTGTSRISKASGAPVVPFFTQRLPGTRGYKVQIEPMLENFPTDDPVADTERIHRTLEQQILQAPEQYLWSHDRFKIMTRP